MNSRRTCQFISFVGGGQDSVSQRQCYRASSDRADGELGRGKRRSASPSRLLQNPNPGKERSAPGAICWQRIAVDRTVPLKFPARSRGARGSAAVWRPEWPSRILCEMGVGWCPHRAESPVHRDGTLRTCLPDRQAARPTRRIIITQFLRFANDGGDPCIFRFNSGGVGLRWAAAECAGRLRPAKMERS